jgi:sortase A
MIPYGSEVFYRYEVQSELMNFNSNFVGEQNGEQSNIGQKVSRKTEEVSEKNKDKNSSQSNTKNTNGNNNNNNNNTNNNTNTNTSNSNNSNNSSNDNANTSSNINNTQNNITNEEIKLEIDRLNDLYKDLEKKNQILFANGQKTLKDPFSYQSSSIDLTKYGLKKNLLGFINIPKIKVTIPLYLGANKSNMKLGAVHLTNTSYTIGGSSTNSVIAAHRGYSRTAMFRNLDKLKTGDRIYVKNFMEILAYEVERKEVILPTDVSKLLIVPNDDRITLITCHPYRKNTHRLAVYCKRVVFDSRALAESNFDVSDNLIKIASKNTNDNLKNKETANNSQNKNQIQETNNKNKNQNQENGLDTEGRGWSISEVLSSISEHKTIWEKIRLVLFILLLLMFISGIVYSVVSIIKKIDNMTHNRDYTTQPNVLTDAEKQDWKMTPVEKGKAYIDINSKIPVSMSDSGATLRLVNPPYSDFIVEVEFKLKENEKIVYKTKPLNPGTILNTVKLDTKLTKGIHKVEVIYYFYNSSMKLQTTHSEDVEFDVN